MNALEPTLQPASLPRSMWETLAEVPKMFDAGTLKDSKKGNPLRRKANPQLMQNQVGINYDEYSPTAFVLRNLTKVNTMAGNR